MSHSEDLDEFESELELRLRREYSDVYPLFRYCVRTYDCTYLCNEVERDVIVEAASPLFHIRMRDVWVWDGHRPSRIIPSVEVHTSHDVTLEVLRADEATPRPADDGDTGAER